MIRDEREAAAAILVACMAADGTTSPDEAQALAIIIKFSHLFDGMDIRAVVEQAENNYNLAGGAAAVIDACAFSIPEKTRLPLFVACMDIVLAKGLVEGKEAEILLYLKGVFRVSDKLFQHCAEVLTLKNRL